MTSDSKYRALVAKLTSDSKYRALVAKLTSDSKYRALVAKMTSDSKCRALVAKIASGLRANTHFVFLRTGILKHLVKKQWRDLRWMERGGGLGGEVDGGNDYLPS